MFIGLTALIMIPIKLRTVRPIRRAANIGIPRIWVTPSLLSAPAPTGRSGTGAAGPGPEGSVLSTPDSISVVAGGITEVPV